MTSPLTRSLHCESTRRLSGFTVERRDKFERVFPDGKVGVALEEAFFVDFDGIAVNRDGRAGRRNAVDFKERRTNEDCRAVCGIRLNEEFDGAR